MVQVRWGQSYLFLGKIVNREIFVFGIPNIPVL